MNGIEPVVRHMLLCQRVEHDPDNPASLNLYGLTHSVQVQAGEDFPIRLPLLTVLLQMTGGRGSGSIRIQCVCADSEELVFEVPTRVVQFGSDPLLVQGLLFRILDVPLPAPGIFWIQCVWNDHLIAQEPLVVRHLP